MNICDFIGVGRENAVDRFKLMELTGLPDRQVRKLIQNARDRGEIIINDQTGAGYYRSEDIGELRRQFNTNKNRALSILRQNVQIARKIVQIEEANQITIEEVAADG